MKKIKVGVLGATGVVGQMIIHLLENHPWFEISEIAASERTSGKTYAEVMDARWSIGNEIPETVRDLVVKDCNPKLDCDIILSALDSSVAFEIEEKFAKFGYPVSTNAMNHRMEEDVPLLIPEVNPNHLGMIKIQKERRGWTGFIVANPNCSTIQLCLALKPLYDSFGIEKVMVTTMQALSGAGYPGVPSLDAIDNVLPFIKGEEEKIETEPLKIFGSLSNKKIIPESIDISAQCNRVAVKYGHMESISVKLSNTTDKDGIIKAFNNFNPIKNLCLPSAPKNPIIYLHNDNRPQPKLDVDAENGMASIIGRLRKCNILDYKFTVLGHNLIRGAAGGTILNAELLKVNNYI
jgi:aspartate-semialdehyde dehydrogenase